MPRDACRGATAAPAPSSAAPAPRSRTEGREVYRWPSATSSVCIHATKQRGREKLGDERTAVWVQRARQAVQRSASAPSRTMTRGAYHADSISARGAYEMKKMNQQ